MKLSSIFQESRLAEFATMVKLSFKHAKPYSYVVIGNFMDEKLLTDAMNVFPAPPEVANPPSTTFIKLPGENDSLDDLREARNKGRLSTSVVTDNLQ